MKRLSSTIAKRAFELFVKKKLNVVDVQLQFWPYFSYSTVVQDSILANSRTLCMVMVEVTYHDCKGYAAPLIAYYKEQVGYNTEHVNQLGTSCAKLLRWMTKEAKRGTSFYVDGCEVLNSHDSIEQMLVDFDLATTAAIRHART